MGWVYLFLLLRMSWLKQWNFPQPVREPGAQVFSLEYFFSVTSGLLLRLTKGTSRSHSCSSFPITVERGLQADTGNALHVFLLSSLSCVFLSFFSNKVLFYSQTSASAFQEDKITHLALFHSWTVTILQALLQGFSFAKSTQLRLHPCFGNFFLDGIWCSWGWPWTWTFLLPLPPEGCDYI